MDLKARKISGSSFTAEDKLEVSFNSDGQDISIMTHTIELISGANVIHGGGAAVDEHLHYKNTRYDANFDGIIDYSTVVMSLSQLVKGTSVIKVVCSLITQAEKEEFEAAIEALEDGGEYPTLERTVFKTGEITLEWADDTFV